MDFSWLTNDTLAMAIAMLVGFFLKTNPKAKEFYLTKLTPVFTFIVLLINQIAVQVADAGTLAPMVAISGGVWAFFQPIIKALIETLVVTGLHSAPKNVAQGVKGIASVIDGVDIEDDDD